MALRQCVIILALILTKCTRIVYGSICIFRITILYYNKYFSTKTQLERRKKVRKSRVYRYYSPYSESNTLFERQLKRIKHDPIRLYDDSNENLSIKTMKGRRLG